MKHLLTASILALLLTACAPTEPPKRYAMVTGLHPEKEAYYRQLHAEPWPSVIAKIEECNIRNFSIHRTEIDGKPYLIAYFEYVGKDFEADMAKMAAEHLRNPANCLFLLIAVAVE